MRVLKCRLATDSDVFAIADVHAHSWGVAYRGLVPDDYLDREVHVGRAEEWRKRFAADRTGTLTLVAEQNGKIVGFAHTIIDHKPEWGGSLLDNLHVEPSLKRRGVGRQLMLETAAHLLQIGTNAGMYLWVIEGNTSARIFYENMGGTIAAYYLEQGHGFDLPLVRYVWPNVAALHNSLAGGER